MEYILFRIIEKSVILLENISYERSDKMFTTFQSIYDLNSIITNDSRIVGKPKNLVYQLYYSYLVFGISYFRKKCYQNLDDFVPFSQIEYSFIGNGSTKTFNLSPIPPTVYDGFYVSVNDVDTGITYGFDPTTNIMTINPAPPLDAEIYIANYVIGQFNNVQLTLSEMVILAESCSVPYLKAFVQKSTLLSQMVYSSDFKIFSQGSHILAVSKVADEQYFKTVKSLINDYSYNENPNGVLGLGGGILNPTSTMGDYSGDMS